MLSAQNVVDILAVRGVVVAVEDVAPLLNAIDQAAVATQERARISIQVWDKVSPLNGVSASAVLARQDIAPDGEIYLLFRDGALLYLQPHDPNSSGIVAMTSINVNPIASQHADSVATQFSAERVVEEVLSAL